MKRRLRRKNGLCYECEAKSDRYRCRNCALKHRGSSNRARSGGVGFKINMVAYDRMFAEQGGMCAVCRGKMTVARGPYIDHDHVSGEVRGLLCLHCNTLIGYAKDDAAVLRQAAEYLEKETV